MPPRRGSWPRPISQVVELPFFADALQGDRPRLSFAFKVNVEDRLVLRQQLLPDEVKPGGWT
jgi:hypothetical protein